MATTKITSPELFDLASLNTALQLPSGTTAERPTSPSTGEWRYNTTTNLVEFWDGGAWRDLQSEDIPPIPSENFNTVLYDGNGSTNNITGVGFQPDLVWIKQRDTAVENHNWYDSTRGVRNFIVSNSTAANVLGSTQRLNAFGADGFTVGSDNEINDSGSKYVAWCWKANGGTTSSNTDGTQTSTVQVNAKAGFSIVQYTASAAGASETVGHGLGTTPGMIILKRTDATEDWYVWHKDLGACGSALNQFLRLNTTASQATATNLFNTVNSTVFNPSYTSGVPNTNIAYCFAEKAEYSKFGSYIGNGSSNGPVVNTGFEPAYIMIKNSTAIYEWTVYDNKRSTSNPRNNVLYPNTTGEENSGETGDIDFLTNGFQPKAPNGTINHNGGTMIYAAFAADQSAAPALADSFNISLWTGNGSSQSISGLGFSPNWVWGKERSNTSGNELLDTLRGATNYISSNSTGAQATSAQGLQSFDSGGFSVGNDGAWNQNGETYVGWSWKANPVPTINTNGTIQSVVSASQAAGFSIVSYTGDGASAATVGHGLSAKCDVVIIKGLDSADKWIVQLPQLGDNARMVLEGTAAKTDDSTTAQAGNASYFGIGGDNSVNKSNEGFIAYCFTSISGFSKIGTYSGTGSSNPITGLGFSPNWVMIKCSTQNENWAIFDTSRGENVLYANAANAESAFSPFTFDSDGFTVPAASGMTNGSGQTYIYIAFKENPTPIVIPAGEMAYMVVAGGAGGGSGLAGGGGAGGLRTSYGSLSGGGASGESNISLSSGTYTITIGAGAVSASSGLSYQGNDGNTSSITGNSNITVSGGGGGGSFKNCPTKNSNGDTNNGRAGGSGGGGAYTNVNTGTGCPVPERSSVGGAGTSNQGFAGGGSPGSSQNHLFGPGGGGGAAGAGTNGTTTGYRGGGPGGAGLSVAITGSAVFYAGGGGGGSEGVAGAAGGNGGGGQGGGTGGTTPVAGTANTGGGGGGNGSTSSTTPGAGGSGVVILRLNTSDYSGTTTGSPTVTTVGSETILTYTGSGTYVHS